MNEDINKGKGLRSLLRRLCFIAFGISTFSNPLDRLNPYSILFGVFIGLIFSGLFTVFIQNFLGLFNSKYKKENGKETIRHAVDQGMLFMVPFAVMILIATYYLNWSTSAGFISAGFMAVGTASAIEMGKLKGKQEIRNTIATSGVSYLFSFVWVLSFQYLIKVPPVIEGGVSLIRTLLSSGGGGL